MGVKVAIGSRGAGTHFTAVAAQPDLLGTLGLSV